MEEDCIYFAINDYISGSINTSNSKTKYEWKPTFFKKYLLFVQNVVDDLNIHFKLSIDDSVWLRVPINAYDFDLKYVKEKISKPQTPRKSTIYKELTHEIGKFNNIIKIEYTGTKYFDLSDGKLNGDIYIKSVTLFTADISKLIKSNNHKITCLVEYDRSIKLARSYLGRAQDIVTNENQGRRTYTWTADMNSSSLHNLDSQYDWNEYITDLGIINLTENINIKALLSHRYNVKQSKHVSDHDEYTNSYRALPLVLSGIRDIFFKFYNFKHHPPSSLVVPFTFKDFETKITTKKVPELNAVITVHYKGELNIYKVILTVGKYKTSLNLKKGQNSVTH